MKTLYTFILAIAFASCTQVSREANNQMHQSVETISMEKTRSAKESKEAKPNIYVDAVGYFPETKEFYVTLPFKEDIDYKKFEEIGKLADSTVFQDEETSRERLPLQIALKYLDLSLLDTINIYDSSHNFVCGASFERVEYYQPTIESSFIAVFKPSVSITELEEGYYCLTPTNQSLKEISFVEKKSTTLKNRIKGELSINPNYEWASKHITLKKSGITLSIYSADAKNENRTLSYLTELRNGKLNVLNKFNGEYAFWDLLPLPISHNDHPVLLITMAVPETDASLIYVPFIWENSGYKMVKNRFHLQEL